MSLVYLVTGLPDLKWSEPPPISPKIFLSRALASLSGKDLKEIELLWWHFEIGQTTRIRSTLLSSDPNTESETIQRQILSARTESIETHDLVLPQWVTENEEHQVLMRRWYREVFLLGKTAFLKRLADLYLNFDEALTGLTSRQLKFSKQAYLLERLGNFDSTADVMDRNYDKSDLGLSAVFPEFHELQNIFASYDATTREERLNRIKWDWIQKNKPFDFFKLEFAVAYFFELQILTRKQTFSSHKGELVFQTILNNSIEETLSC